jgi:LysR family hydrogen peroxide-inducible transcriptional activator
MIYSKNLLKIPIIEALSDTIEGILRGAIQFENIKVITPK